MLSKQCFIKYPAIFLLIIALCSCDKSLDNINVRTAEFTATSETVYSYEPVIFEANDTLGGLNYNWDFGDGTSLKGGGYKVTHQFPNLYYYNANYIVELEIDGLKDSTNIEVLPGSLSYEIVNKSIKYMNVLTYIDNYETGCVKRFDINSCSKTNIIYAKRYTPRFYGPVEFPLIHIFGISIFMNNTEYTLPELYWITDYQHSIITLTDSTQVVCRSSHGLNDTKYYLKDLPQ
jgi:hypothetical protein